MERAAAPAGTNSAPTSRRRSQRHGDGDDVLRIALAWRELRRGAAAAIVRDHLYGTDDDAIEQGQMDTLDVLMTRDAWRMSELAEALRVDPSTATRSVQRLVTDGLAERQASDDDGRVVLVAPSADGRRRHARVAERRSATVKRLLAEFEPEERRQLADLLGRLVTALDHFVGDLDDTGPLGAGNGEAREANSKRGK